MEIRTYRTQEAVQVPDVVAESRLAPLLPSVPVPMLPPRVLLGAAGVWAGLTGERLAGAPEPQVVVVLVATDNPIHVGFVRDQLSIARLAAVLVEIARASVNAVVFQFGAVYAVFKHPSEGYLGLVPMRQRRRVPQPHFPDFGVLGVRVLALIGVPADRAVGQ